MNDKAEGLAGRRSLVRLDLVPESIKARCQMFVDRGMLAALVCSDGLYVSISQIKRLENLGFLYTQGNHDVASIAQLFPSDKELSLRSGTSLFQTSEPQVPIDGGEFILQLLPYICENIAVEKTASIPGVVQFAGTAEELFSTESKLLAAAATQQDRLLSGKILRSAGFARSAHYLGSKASLAPSIIEVIDRVLPKNGVVVDLMCGSGAASGAFARKWKTYASDAQQFSVLLGTVQGGGFDPSRAEKVLKFVLLRYKEHYAKLQVQLSDEIEKEEVFLTSEIDESTVGDFFKWISEYSVIQTAWRQSKEVRTEFSLFSSYYANLFFGIRQSAEIDSLRYAIEGIADPVEKSWGLGALLCAVSACADTFGGHFAQPRVRLDDIEDVRKKFAVSLMRRGLSIKQEFAARFLSLAKESESVEFPVIPVAGPWRPALQQLSTLISEREVLVYLDPPYTRDEYSRYYHVLETLVLYNYPMVDGRALVPTKGSLNRFSSEFFSRNVESIEASVATVISACLARGWSVMLSYASSGTASLEKVVASLEGQLESTELFRTGYTHVAHGKLRAHKKIDEYLVLFKPAIGEAPLHQPANIDNKLSA